MRWIHVSDRMRILALIILLVGVVVGCGAEVEPPTPVQQYQQYSNGVAFDMLYPSEWENEIVTQGILVFARPENLNLEIENPEASVVVFRQQYDIRIEQDERFDHYVESGPLQSGYETDTQILETTLGGLPAHAIRVVSDEADSDLGITSYIVGTQVGGGFDYYFTATAPSDEWDIWWPTFQVMLGSVSFNE